MSESTNDGRTACIRYTLGITAFVWLYAAIVWILADTFRDGRGVPAIIIWVPVFAFFAVQAFLVIAPMQLLRTLLSGKSLRTREGWADARSRFDKTFLARWFLATSLLWPMKSAFRTVKVSIPEVLPFSWDSAFAAAERALHLGVWPWQVALAVLPPGPWVRVLDYLYGPTWFLVLFITLLAIVGAAPLTRSTLRYMLVYPLCWIGIGNLLAVPLASGGPIFYGLIHPQQSDPFLPLLGSLEGARWTVSTMAKLWGGYLGQQPAFGISAMPSVHVAVTFALYLFARSLRRPVRIVAATYFAVVLFGSVRLGWHYIIDGYVSIAVVACLWWAAGRIVDRLESEDASTQSQAGDFPNEGSRQWASSANTAPSLSRRATSATTRNSG